MKKTFKQRMSEFFSFKAPSTNGNKYEVHKDLQIQEQIDINTLQQLDKAIKSDARDIETMSEAIRRISEQLVKEKNIDEYFLLQSEADYFCNTCMFETKDIQLRKNIINVIRGAFLFGTAGFYKHSKTDLLEPVYINSMDYDITGRLKSCKILPLNVVLSKMNDTKMNFRPDEMLGYRTITDTENIASFSWGTMGYSCWYKIWPFVKLKSMMLQIIIINGYVFNKKWMYKLNNYSNISKEIELFFNPANPFLVNIGTSEDVANRFSTEEGTKTTNTSDVIDYYNKMMGVYYQILGRRVNSDYKRERNISDEVEASQENYDIIQSDWLNQFAMFIEELKGMGLKVEIVKKEDKQKQEQKENGKDDSNNE